MAQILDGKQLAATKKRTLTEACNRLTNELGRPPCLAVILVGNDPASQTYVRYKIKMCSELGIKSISNHLIEDTSQDQLIGLIEHLNQDIHVDGILLQLPLPKHLDHYKAIHHIAPSKDVDGLHPYNQGLLTQGKPGLIPCTPKGCLQLILSCCTSLDGIRVVIIGRSVLVGRPLALLLLNHNATVTIAHSKTHNLKQVCREADILVAAAGQPHLITGEYIKPGAIVIDVGQSRIGNKIAGDVEPASVSSIASFLTPVPGGVGPMTIINLMENLLHAAALKIDTLFSNS